MACGAQGPIAVRRHLLYLLRRSRPAEHRCKLEEAANGRAHRGGLVLLLEVGIQFVRFAAVGVIGTIGHYAVLVALVHLIGVHPVIASAAGSVVGALLNYALNYKFTFKSNERHTVALPKFFIIMSIGFTLNLAIMYVGVSLWEIYYLLVQVVATGIVLMWNFLGNRFWTFGNDRLVRQEGGHARNAHLAGPCASAGGKGFRSWISRLT